MTNLVKNSAPPHLHECHFYLPGRPACVFFRQIGIQHQKEQIVRQGKLRRRSEPAILCIKTPAQHLHCLSRKLFPDFFIDIIRVIFRCTDLVNNGIRRGCQSLSVALPFLRDHKKQICKTDHARAGFRRIISPRKERFLCRRHKNAHRPAAASRKRLTDRHIDTVNIGTFFPVYLDGNKIAVQDLRDLLIFKTLMRHHMAPVAGTVTDTQEYRFIFPLCLFKCFCSPRIPVYRVPGVL